MKITEIIAALTTIQQNVTNDLKYEPDALTNPGTLVSPLGLDNVEDLCILSVQLAIHIQQLELDRDKLFNKLGGKESLTVARLTRFDDEDKEKIVDEVIQAARWYVNLTGNIDDTICRTEEYKRLWGAVVAYNATIGAEEPLKTRR